VEGVKTGLTTGTPVTSYLPSAFRSGGPQGHLGLENGFLRR
jgi:hypothetical protein